VVPIDTLGVAETDGICVAIGSELEIDGDGEETGAEVQPATRAEMATNAKRDRRTGRLIASVNLCVAMPNRLEMC
jgi:hypothetical protein